MLRHRLALMLLIYAVLDFANPLMPGAVTFDAEDSVEGVRAERVRGDRQDAALDPSPVLVRAAVLRRDPPSRSAAEPRPRPSRQHLAGRRDLTPSPEPAAPDADH